MKMDNNYRSLFYKNDFQMFNLENIIGYGLEAILVAAAVSIGVLVIVMLAIVIELLVE